MEFLMFASSLLMSLIVPNYGTCNTCTFFVSNFIFVIDQFQNTKSVTDEESELDVLDKLVCLIILN
jgi:hypothetical protein